jgi:hypothetical protein
MQNQKLEMGDASFLIFDLIFYLFQSSRLSTSSSEGVGGGCAGSKTGQYPSGVTLNPYRGES